MRKKACYNIAKTNRVHKIFFDYNRNETEQPLLQQQQQSEQIMATASIDQNDTTNNSMTTRIVSEIIRQTNERVERVFFRIVLFVCRIFFFFRGDD